VETRTKKCSQFPSLGMSFSKKIICLRFLRVSTRVGIQIFEIILLNVTAIVLLVRGIFFNPYNVKIYQFKLG
jgi:hypothetical protein